jgi:metallo-beta-lactamase family protein
MRLQFLGAATTVTGSQFLLETERAKVLIDAGLFQGNPHEAMRNRVPLAYDPKELSALLLTHAHLDHCGLIPVVVHEGFGGPIFATAGTQELTNLVLLDSAKLQEEFSQRADRIEERHPGKAAKGQHRDEIDLAVALAEAGGEEESAVESRDPEVLVREQLPCMECHIKGPLYVEKDVIDTMRLFRPIAYDKEVEVAPGVWATFRDAGHILGSAMIQLRVRDSDGAPERVVVFSGDIGRTGTPIIRDPSTITDADYVLMESTYGGREHEPSGEALRILTETIQLVAQAKGVLLVPSFAIGRTQEVVFQLDRLLKEGKIPQLPLYLDSPMASKATDIYRRHADYFDDETKALLAQRDDPLDYPGAEVTNDSSDSKAIKTKPRPYMIVASNGMLTGGRVLFHLRDLISDPTATILFVGYQGEGTLGAHLQQGAKQVRVDGEMRDVRCQVRSISGFSAHADESELLDWAGAFVKGKAKGAAGYPRRLFVVHGDPPAEAAIVPKLQALGLDVHVPKWREAVELG